MRSKKNRLIEILQSGGVIRCPEIQADTNISNQAKDDLHPDLTCPHPPQPITHQQLLQAYFRIRHLRPDSQRSYRSVFSAFEHAIPNSLPDTVTTDQIIHWRQSRIATGLKSVSWNSYMRHLLAVFRFGLKEMLLQRTDNPFDGLSLPSEKRKKKVLPAEQITATIEEFNALHHLEITGELSSQRAGRISPPWFWRTIFETLYHTGIRRNQLVHLRRMDVDLHENKLHIRVEGSKTRREYDVPVNKVLQPWLELLLDKADKAGIEPHGQLFNITCFKSGFRKHKTMNVGHLSKGFTDLSKRLGFLVSPHRFRHTLGTSLMRNAKANLHLVKALLGHTSLSTTLEYIEPDMEQMRELLDARSERGMPDIACSRDPLNGN